MQYKIRAIFIYLAPNRMSAWQMIEAHSATTANTNFEF